MADEAAAHEVGQPVLAVRIGAASCWPSCCALAAARLVAVRRGTRAQLSVSDASLTRPSRTAPGRRIGVMGGTFDPIHHGHLVAASEVQAWFDLDEVVFVPTGDPWQKSDRQVSPAEHRYLMTVIATASNPRFRVSRVDIDRDGPTYTIDTLRDLRRQLPDADLYFITGADALADIFTWRDADELFDLAQFVGCTRPGYAMDAGDAGQDPRRPGDAGRDAGAGDLLHRLPRARAARGAGLVPRARRGRAVHRQARPLSRPDPDAGTHGRKARGMTATDHATDLVHTAALAASDKLAQHIVAFDVSDQLAITDAFLLASAPNDRQVRAIVDEIEKKLRERDAKPIRREGHREGRWVLLDYGDIVVHVQHEEERQFYALERLWRDCPVIALPDEVTQGEPEAGPTAGSPAGAPDTDG